jgi:hypothetical protein
MSDLSVTTLVNEPPAPQPLSLQSAKNLLTLTPNDPESIMQVAQGLIETIKSREVLHRQELQQHQHRDQVWDEQLEELAAWLWEYQAADHARPEGYLWNDPERAPNFMLPLQENVWEQAYWVRLLPGGMVAGLPCDSTTHDTPFIKEIFADPYAYKKMEDNENTMPVEPLQPWLEQLLTGPANLYDKLLGEVQRMGPWGLVAKVERYRAQEQTYQDLQARIRALQQQLEGVRQSQEAGRGWMERAQLDLVTGRLKVAHRHNEWVVGHKRTRYWKQGPAFRMESD